MRLKATLATALLATVTLMAAPPVDNPMTRAVLRVYEDQLKADPTDWDTWLRAANEYYTHSEYYDTLWHFDKVQAWAKLNEWCTIFTVTPNGQPCMRLVHTEQN